MHNPDRARLVLNIQPLHMSDDQFFNLCAANRDLRTERTSHGEMIVMTPAGGETNNRNVEVLEQPRQRCRRRCATRLRA